MGTSLLHFRTRCVSARVCLIKARFFGLHHAVLPNTRVESSLFNLTFASFCFFHTRARVCVCVLNRLPAKASRSVGVRVDFKTSTTERCSPLGGAKRSELRLRGSD